MQMTNFSLETTDWSRIEQIEHKGEAGLAYWQTRNFGDIRVRIVECSPGYVADHWCQKGHILFCLDGDLHVELEDGRILMLKAGMSFQVGDNIEPHRISTMVGAKFFVVD